MTQARETAGIDLEVGDITQVFQKPIGLLQFLFETTVIWRQPRGQGREVSKLIV